jgi:hypothetical protein
MPDNKRFRQSYMLFITSSLHDEADSSWTALWQLEEAEFDSRQRKSFFIPLGSILLRMYYKYITQVY